PTCNRITALYKEIYQLEKQVNQVVNTQKDSFDAYKRDVKNSWNEEINKSFSAKKDENGVEILKFCSKCDIGNDPETVYCINCGNKF
ncbi:MAG: hypothetical protein ACRC1P_02265, partial [Cellulosilyticaceae bacterium]